MQTETREATRRRFTVHEYHRMAEAGILHEDDRVELIDGEIVEMSRIDSRHALCVSLLNRLLVRGVGDRAIVSPQNPVRLDERHEPQPDLTVIRDRAYGRSLPTPGDTLLLIEVSDTILSYDRNVKLPIYARAGIPEVWIVDVNGQKVERHTGPSGASYRHTELARKGETLASTTLPDLTLRADDVLGRT
ncbi:Uma2 family endonuclease [Rubrobacter tropicus]|uniref:Uma2 family endonuclease n=1 Tax=Rubrobacter tropicus TaxID=2653851 RepID=UPI001A9E5389|nr:Uma2 family endonuclease [Rubrobacter tropicus]